MLGSVFRYPVSERVGGHVDFPGNLGDRSDSTTIFAASVLNSVVYFLRRSDTYPPPFRDGPYWVRYPECGRHASWLRRRLKGGGGSCVLLGVIPEAAELVKAGFVVCCDRFSGRFRRVWGVRHPQPGSRRSARSAARTNGLEAGEDGAILTLAGAGRGAVGVVCSCRVPSSWFAEDQFRRAEVWLPVIPSPLGRGMRRCRSEEHTSELQSQSNLVCRLLLEKKNDLHRVRS